MAKRTYLSAAERAEIMRMRSEGKGVRQIARHFGRAGSTISRMLRRGVRPAPRSPSGVRETWPVSRMELRSVERRIARIEASLARIGRAVSKLQ